MSAKAQLEGSGRKIPTLDSLSAGQIAAIRSIPPHDKAGIVRQLATRPVSMFLERDYFEREQQAVFRRFPVPVIPSNMIAEPGRVIAHDGYGLPLILTRDRDGKVHAFVNACRHKGSKVVEKCESFKANVLSCPYHAWSYALDGRLVGLPREEMFPGIEKKDHGLIELPSREAGGLIWVHLDCNATEDFSHIADALVEDLDALGVPSSFTYGHKSFDLNANWKLVLEPFLEGYHVQRLHAQSIGQLFADVPNRIDRLGPHTRQISGKANFEPAMLDVPGENIHKTVTHAYQVFPNTVVVTSPYYISLMIIMPRAENRSVVDYYMLVPSAPDNPTAEDLYARSYELILKVFGTEDFRAAEISQEGLSTGVIDKMIYGGLETSIPEFYKTLEGYLGINHPL